jgi:aryl-alcohol dehydrogenase-like predicted oxidoreductase
LPPKQHLAAFAEARGHTLLDLAVSWLLTRPVVASVIAGATSAEQVRSNVRAARWHLDTADLARVDELAPAARTVGVRVARAAVGQAILLRAMNPAG